MKVIIVNSVAGGTSCIARRGIKRQTRCLIALLALAAALGTVTSCSSTSKPPPVGSARITYTKGVPGGVRVQTFKTTAKLTAIDQNNHQATLEGPNGKKAIVKIGPGAVNFQKISVGDEIAVTVTQKVIVSLDENASSFTEGNQITAKVVSIDSAKRKVALRFENGETETADVRADVDLSRHKVGEQVFFRVVEMTVIWVEKVP